MSCLEGVFSVRKVKKGFTLIEMLVVIAVIAILIAIIVPTVNNAVNKAKASADAANLRSILGVANVELVDSDVDVAVTTANMSTFRCATFPGAEAYIYYVDPGFMVAYFSHEGGVYTIDSFAEAASSGSAPVAATLPAGGTSYPVGGNGG